MEFRVVPIPESLSEQVRATSRAPGYGHPVHREVAAGYGPCRTCLAPFEKGVERRLLFTYDPFRELEPFPLPGPVFVHEGPCEAYAGDGFPDALRFLPITLNGYGRGRRLHEAIRVEPRGDHEAAIARLLAHADVDYIHARNTEAGCYLFRIERAAGMAE